MTADESMERLAPASSPSARQQNAVDRGLHFLSACSAGFPPAYLAFEPAMTDPVSAEEALHRVRTDLGIDLGFKPGDEGFTAMLALDNLPSPVPAPAGALLRALIRRVESCRWHNRYRFFPEVPEFAADTDCTALATAGLYRHGALRPSELMASALDIQRAGAPGSGEADDLWPGAVMVYWEDGAEAFAGPRGRKHDAVVGANVLRTLHLASEYTDRVRRQDSGATFRYVADHLRSGRYREGTRYYPSPVAFLHAVALLCGMCRESAAELGPLLRTACAGLSAPTNALDLSLFITAAETCGAPGSRDDHRAALVDLQKPDGSWPAHGYFRFGRIPIYFGSAHLTTVFALRALASGRPGHVRGDRAATERVAT